MCSNQRQGYCHCYVDSNDRPYKFEFYDCWGNEITEEEFRDLDPDAFDEIMYQSGFIKNTPLLKSKASKQSPQGRLLDELNNLKKMCG